MPWRTIATFVLCDIAHKPPAADICRTWSQVGLNARPHSQQKAKAVARTTPERPTEKSSPMDEIGRSEDADDAAIFVSTLGTDEAQGERTG